MRVDVLMALLDKSVNDEEFRTAAHRDPRAALQAHGFVLSSEEYDAFMDFQTKAVEMSSSVVRH